MSVAAAVMQAMRSGRADEPLVLIAAVRQAEGRGARPVSRCDRQPKRENTRKAAASRL